MILSHHVKTAKNTSFCCLISVVTQNYEVMYSTMFFVFFLSYLFEVVDQRKGPERLNEAVATPSTMRCDARETLFHAKLKDSAFSHWLETQHRRDPVRLRSSSDWKKRHMTLPTQSTLPGWTSSYNFVFIFINSIIIWLIIYADQF